MAERTDWKGMHAECAADVERLKKELLEAVESGLSLGKENDELREEVLDLRKAIERARIQGMNDVTGLLLREQHS
jgi:regulator of replication initiation timing